MLINFNKSKKIEEWKVGRVETPTTRRDNRGGLLRAVLVYEYRGGYRVRNTLVDRMPWTCYWFCPRKLITLRYFFRSRRSTNTINQNIDPHSFSKSVRAWKYLRWIIYEIESENYIYIYIYHDVIFCNIKNNLFTTSLKFTYYQYSNKKKYI